MQRFIHGKEAAKYLSQNGFNVRTYRTDNRRDFRFSVKYGDLDLGKGYTFEGIARFATAYSIGLDVTPHQRDDDPILTGAQYPDWL